MFVPDHDLVYDFGRIYRSYIDRNPEEELAGIVKEVNRTLVLPEERLSDSVYRYDRESGKVRIA